jgi:hypothetical protein
MELYKAAPRPRQNNGILLAVVIQKVAVIQREGKILERNYRLIIIIIIIIITEALFSDHVSTFCVCLNVA